jgi:hypothetical protein
VTFNTNPPNPRCVICGDARGTRYVCAPCKADPANVDWRESSALELVAGEPRGHVPAPEADDEFSPKFVSVASLLLTERGLSLRAVARRCHCSLAFVRKVLNRVSLLRKDPK